MPYSHLFKLLLAACLTLTLPSISLAQPAGSGDLPTDIKALLEELRQGRTEPLNPPSSGDQPPGASVENGPEPSGKTTYDDAYLRYTNLAELITRMGVDAMHAAELERQLRALQKPLARTPAASAGHQSASKPCGTRRSKDSADASPKAPCQEDSLRRLPK